MPITQPLVERPNIERSPFLLKRVGRFEESIALYCKLLGEAQPSGNDSMIRTCFREMFDVVLLSYLRSRVTLTSKQELRDRLFRDLHEAVPLSGKYDDAWFDRTFEDLWEPYAVSRRAGGFSVDRRYLVQKRGNGSKHE